MGSHTPLYPISDDEIEHTQRAKGSNSDQYSRYSEVDDSIKQYKEILTKQIDIDCYELKRLVMKFIHHIETEVPLSHQHCLILRQYLTEFPHKRQQEQVNVLPHTTTSKKHEHVTDTDQVFGRGDASPLVYSDSDSDSEHSSHGNGVLYSEEKSQSRNKGSDPLITDFKNPRLWSKRDNEPPQRKRYTPSTPVRVNHDSRHQT